MAFAGWEDAARVHGAPIFYAFIAWSLLYQLARRTAPARLDEPTKGYWASSCVSSVHGVVITYLAWRGCRDAGLWTTASAHVTSDSTYAAMHVFLGYIIEDCFPLLYYRREWSSTRVYVIHHVASLVDWGFCMLVGTCHMLAVPMLLCEVTAPFTNGRWFLATIGGRWKAGTLYTVNGLAMTVLFFLTRVLLPGWLGYSTFPPTSRLHASYFGLPAYNYVLMTAGYLTGYALQVPSHSSHTPARPSPSLPATAPAAHACTLARQLFWFEQIFRGLLKVLRGGRPAAKKV